MIRNEYFCQVDRRKHENDFVMFGLEYEARHNVTIL